MTECKNIKEQRRHNSTYKKLAVQWFNEALCFVSSSVVSGQFSASKSPTSCSCKTLCLSLDNQNTKNIMTPEEILKNAGNEKFEVNIGVSLIRLLEITNRNQEYLREIFKEQLIIKEMVKGKTELPEGFEDKLFDLETKIWDASKVKFHKLLDGILDTN
jgi:hypothetical protein